MARAKRLIDQIKEEGLENAALLEAAGITAPLTDLQERLAVEYVKDLNLSRACERADVNRSTGQEAIKNHRFLARVRQLWDVDEARRRTAIDNVLAGFWKVYDRCMQQVPVTEWDPGTKTMVETGEWMFNAAGALKALELMGKHLAMFTEKYDINIKEGLGDRVHAARMRIKAEREAAQNQTKLIAPPKRGLPTVPRSVQ